MGIESVMNATGAYNFCKLANNHMHNEQAGHALQATALVNEASLKLSDNSVDW